MKTKQIEALEYLLDILDGKITEDGSIEKAQELCNEALKEIETNEKVKKSSWFFGLGISF